MRPELSIAITETKFYAELIQISKISGMLRVLA